LQSCNCRIGDGVLKFADNTKLGKAVNILKHRAAIQTDLHRLEEWVNKGLMKMHKENCKTLCPRQKTPLQ